MRIWTSGSRCPRIGLRGGYYSSIQIHPVVGVHSMGGTVTKGNRLQVLARKELEKQGYVVHTAVRSVQKRGPIWISQSTDIFNAFDLIATRIDPPQPLRFVQVTTASHVSERIRKVDPVPINPGLTLSRCERTDSCNPIWRNAFAADAHPVLAGCWGSRLGGDELCLRIELVQVPSPLE